MSPHPEAGLDIRKPSGATARATWLGAHQRPIRRRCPRRSGVREAPKGPSARLFPLSNELFEMGQKSRYCGLVC